MKKLYRKSTVHPSPSPSSSSSSSSSSLSCTSPTPDQISLSFLPATILTLAAALSAADREVLAYLLSSSTTPLVFHSKKTSHNNNNNHARCFTCYCFTCYTSYWARWDSSPNRQLIHEIIDAFEDELLKQRNHKHSHLTRKAKRKSNINTNKNSNININDVYPNGLTRVDTNSGRVEINDESCGNIGDENEEKQSGSVRKIVSFIGERIWGGIWG